MVRMWLIGVVKQFKMGPSQAINYTQLCVIKATQSTLGYVLEIPYITQSNV